MNWLVRLFEHLDDHGKVSSRYHGSDCPMCNHSVDRPVFRDVVYPAGIDLFRTGHTITKRVFSDDLEFRTIFQKQMFIGIPDVLDIFRAATNGIFVVHVTCTNYRTLRSRQPSNSKLFLIVDELPDDPWLIRYTVGSDLKVVETAGNRPTTSNRCVVVIATSPDKLLLLLDAFSFRVSVRQLINSFQNVMTSKLDPDCVFFGL